MTDHLKDQAMCEAFLKVARQGYPDLLLKVRESVARAMSGWLLLHGVRGEIKWSLLDGCFVGQLKGVGEDISFRGETPAEVEQAFAEAVRLYLLKSVA